MDSYRGARRRGAVRRLRRLMGLALATAVLTVVPATSAPAQDDMSSTDSDPASMVISPDTTVGDLIAWLTEEEAACLAATAGDAVLEAMQDVAVLTVAGDPRVVGLLVSCLVPDTFLLFGVAFMDGKAGGWSPESRECLTSFVRDHPEFIYTTFHVQGVGESRGAEQDHEDLLAFYGCMTTVDAVTLMNAFWSAMGSSVGAEITTLVGFMTDDEVQCILDHFGITREQFDAMVQTRMTGGGASFGGQTGCVTTEFYARMFVPVVDAYLGPLSDDSLACLADFASEHSHAVAFIGQSAGSSVDPEDFAEIAADGQLMFQCMQDEELRRVQVLAVDALTGIRPAAGEEPAAEEPTVPEDTPTG